MARLSLDRDICRRPLFRALAGALAAGLGAVCPLLASDVDFRWSRLRLAWALQLIDRRGRDRRARRRDPLDESENANAPAVRRETERDRGR